MATAFSSTDPWEVACIRYLEDLDEDEKNMFTSASPETLYYSTSVAQKEHQNESRSRALSGKLQPFVAAICQYGEILDVYSNAYPLIMAPLWGSVRVLLHIANAFEKYFEKLVEMLTRIGDVLPRCQVYQSLFATQERLLQAIATTYLDVIQFCIQAKRTFRKMKKSTTAHFTWKIIWKDFNGDFDGILTRFRNHVKCVDKEAGVSHMIEDSHQWALARLEKKVEKREYLLSQLSSINYTDKHLKKRKKRHAKTGLWLTKSTEFQTWTTTDASCCLWCYGIPGAGKTILASILIDELASGLNEGDITIRCLSSRQLAEKDITKQDTAITFYYCDFSEPESLQIRNILGSLIKQLLETIAIPQPIEEQLEKLYRPLSRTATEDELLQILATVIEHFLKVYIFIDGVDECGRKEQVEVLSMINQFARSQGPIVKLLILSREVTEISASLIAFPRIRISEEKNSLDIGCFIEESVKSRLKSGELTIKDPSLESDIVSALTEGAHGMFLWVHFQLMDLCNTTSDFAIKKALQNLPDGMIRTYARILQRIKKSPSKLALAERIFKWITTARRPLLITELAEAVAFGEDDLYWDESKIPDSKTLQRTCDNLIIFDENDQTVRLAHHTVKQFLTEPPTEDSIPSLHFSITESSVEAGDICLAYLSFSDFETQITRTMSNDDIGIKEIPNPIEIIENVTFPANFGNFASAVFKIRQYLWPKTSKPTSILSNLVIKKTHKPPSQNLKEKYRFLDYVVENWIYHTIDFENDAEKEKRWESFRALAMIKKTPFDIRPWEENLVSGHLMHTALFRWAIDIGHIPLLQLLEKYQGLPKYCLQEHMEGRCPGLTAARNCDKTLIDFLMPKISYNSLEELFSGAVRNGDVSAVKGLLNCGYFSTVAQDAILSAARLRDKSMMELLLELNPALDLAGEWEGRLLAIAGEENSDKLLALLLQKTNNYFQLLFRLQSIWKLTGPDDIMPYTIVNNLWHTFKTMKQRTYGDLDSRSKVSILRYAVQQQKESFVQVLIEDGTYSQAHAAEALLYQAATLGNVNIVLQLLKYGAQANEVSQSGKRTTLMGAVTAGEYFYFYRSNVTEGHIAVVKLLLENLNQADIDVKLERDHTFSFSAIDFAAMKGNEVLVQLLLQRGADATRALASASRYGRLSIVRILVENGVSVNGKDNGGKSALANAVQRGRIEILELLLKKGADLSDWGSCVALNYSVRIIKSQVVEMLLEYGADIEERDHKGRTILFHALVSDNAEIFDILLENGANLNSAQFKGFPDGWWEYTSNSMAAEWSARQWADFFGHRDVLRVIQKHDANVSMSSPKQDISILSLRDTRKTIKNLRY